MEGFRNFGKLIAACGVASAISLAQAQNIVQNPTFSDPAISSTDFPDWTVNLNQGDPGVYTGLNLGPNTTGAANWITTSPFSYQGNGQIDQVLATTPGQTYNITFTAGTNNDTGSPNSLAQLDWGGNLLLDFTNSFTANDTAQTFTATAKATSTSTDLMFQGYQNSGWWDVSSVSVVAGVPETNSLATMSGMLGLGLLAGLRRRRARR